ncbi:MAG: DNA helicase [Ahrensia sp.]|nr:DNA helicase [Ahrensia sp.]|tara:strand:+ start:16434 stop:17147 length:714 start_codon:yes stop_codon:yes gene_type:complete
MKLSAPIYALKREAKAFSRQQNVPLHAALDRIAVREGFSAWSLLAAKAVSKLGPRELFALLDPGDMLLLGARPGQGKTLMSLRIAAEAMKAGRHAVFFTLDYTPLEVEDRFRRIGEDPVLFGDLFACDCSEAIGDSHIIDRLAGAPRGTIAVIDYLQLLDQRRDKPELMQQVRALKAFARERGVTFIFLSQIDRSYDPVAKPCPDIEDVRLPNRLDLSLFDKTCFLHGDALRFVANR